MMLSRALLIAVFTGAATLAAGCSGGGGGSSGPPSVAPPPPPPPPSPPPPPPGNPSSFETAEYDRDYSLRIMNASTAYAAGATGRGVTVAVIDSGLDTAHPEFSGRVSSASRDITSDNRGVHDTDGHGTAVAGIIAAAKDNRIMHGVAFESTILGIRADTPGSCDDEDGDGCTFSDRHIAQAIDHARLNGAAVINLSLGREPGGGDQFTQTFQAMARAAEAGIFLVVSAGNREDADTPPSERPSFPANFANDARARGFAVAVGSVDADGAISAFSNRAQGSEQVYLVAPGDQVVTTFPDDRYVTASGTSFSAPHVSGALALLIQAFPNLSGNDALSILFDTAVDLGATGPDAVYGMGLIDLAAAFQPVGSSSVAMGGIHGQPVSVGALTLAPSGASGDWLWESGFVDGAVLRDGYDRAFRFDPALSGARGDGGLGALETAARAGLARQSVTHAGPASVHMRVTPERTRALRNMPEEVYQDRPDVSFRFTHGAATIEAGRGFAAPGPLPGAGAAVLSETRFTGAVANLTGSRDWATMRWRFGDAAVSFRTAESDLGGVSAAAASWDFGRHQMALEIGEGREGHAALGGRIAGRFGTDDASRNSFAAALWSGDLGLGWRGAARFEQARADIALPAWMGVEDQVAATAWSAGADRAFGPGRFGVTLSQPLRVERGTVSALVPVLVDEDNETIFERRTASLSPSGREVSVETAYRWTVNDTTAASLAARFTREPGHIRGARPEGLVWAGIRTSW